MTDKKCKYCAMMIPHEAKICPHCRKVQGWTLPAKIFAGFLLLMAFTAVTNLSKQYPPSSQAPSPSVTKSVATVSPELKTVKNITIRSRTISTGDTYDSVLEVLSPSEQINQSIHRDDLGNMTLMKYYNADGKKFCLTVARIQNPGPYRVVLIDLQ